MKSPSSPLSAIEKIMEDINTPSSVERAIRQSLSSPLSAVEKIMETLNTQSSSIEKAISQPFSFPLSPIEKVMKESSIEKAIRQAFSSPLSAVEKIMETLNTQSSSIEKAISQPFSFHHPAIEKAFMELFSSQESAVEKTMKMFLESSNLLISDSKYFSAMAESISAIDFGKDLTVYEGELDKPKQQLRKVKDSKAFSMWFSKLPPLIKVLFLYLFLQIITPQINTFLVAPFIESLLAKKFIVEKNDIKQIKKMPLLLGDVAFENVRFITKNNVFLRQEPSRKSAVLDKLTVGKVVTVLSKKGDWIEVVYERQNCESITGWVYKRYTARFAIDHSAQQTDQGAPARTDNCADGRRLSARVTPR
jgi:hypothetical protein